MSTDLITIITITNHTVNLLATITLYQTNVMNYSQSHCGWLSCNCMVLGKHLTGVVHYSY